MLKIIVGKRWPLIAMLFALEVALILIVSNSAFFPGELTNYRNQYNTTSAVLNQTAPGQVAGIFSNNFKVANVELFPAFGLVILGLSIYETARIVEVIGIVKGVPVAAALANLFFLPSTWLELPAYAIAAAESIYLVYAIYLGFKDGWSRFVREIRYLIVNVMLIALVLIVAATFEVTEIQLEQGPYPLLSLATWIPFVLVFWVGLRFWRSAKRDAPALEAHEAAEMAQREMPLPVVVDQGRPQPQNEKDAAGSPASSREKDGATA